MSAYGLVQCQPLKSLKSGNELADDTQKRLDELQAALEANEQRIRELIAD